MRTTTLLYHDVVRGGDFDSSGFPGLRAARYKLEYREFEKHLEAIASTILKKPGSVMDFLRDPGQPAPFFLTFDDGGTSAATEIVDLLEARGWIGHFLITTDFIGRRGFVNRAEIRTLRKRGHVVGSHSCSHPKRMSSCSWLELIKEWETSLQILSDTLGEEVQLASVPGGYYSKKVAQAASSAGIKVLFTSEPTTRAYPVDACLVLGRYTVYGGTRPAVAAGFASSQPLPRLRQYVSWNLKKLAKPLGGEFYLEMRETLKRKS